MPGRPTQPTTLFATTGVRQAPTLKQIALGFLGGRPVSSGVVNYLLGGAWDWISWLAGGLPSWVSGQTVTIPACSLSWTSFNKAGGVFPDGGVTVALLSDISALGAPNSYIAVLNDSTGRYATSSTVLMAGGPISSVTATQVQAGVTVTPGASVTVRVSGQDAAGSPIIETWAKAFEVTTGVTADHVLTRAETVPDADPFYGPLTVEVVLKVPEGSGDTVSIADIILDFA